MKSLAGVAAVLGIWVFGELVSANDGGPRMSKGIGKQQFGRELSSANENQVLTELPQYLDGMNEPFVERNGGGQVQRVQIPMPSATKIEKPTNFVDRGSLQSQNPLSYSQGMAPNDAYYPINTGVSEQSSVMWPTEYQMDTAGMPMRVDQYYTPMQQQDRDQEGTSPEESAMSRKGKQQKFVPSHYPIKTKYTSQKPGQSKAPSEDRVSEIEALVVLEARTPLSPVYMSQPNTDAPPSNLQKRVLNGTITLRVGGALIGYLIVSEKSFAWLEQDDLTGKTAVDTALLPIADWIDSRTPKRVTGIGGHAVLFSVEHSGKSDGSQKGNQIDGLAAEGHTTEWAKSTTGRNFYVKLGVSGRVIITDQTGLLTTVAISSQQSFVFLKKINAPPSIPLVADLSIVVNHTQSQVIQLNSISESNIVTQKPPPMLLSGQALRGHPKRDD